MEVEYGRSGAPAAEESVLDPSPYIIDLGEYGRSKMSEEAEEYWKSLDNAGKQELLTVSASELARFSCQVVKDPWLVDFLSDAIDYFALYGTWEMYLCPDPDCLRLFHDDESLIIHLKCEHLPEICPAAWPPPWRNLFEEQQCADAFRKMVWKPIVVEHALDMLSSMCLKYRYTTTADVRSGSGRLHSLNWLYSEDPRRKSILVALEKKFQILLSAHERASFSFLSDVFLTAMTALAAKCILFPHSASYNTQFLHELLAHSPLSFCLLEADDLDRFVELLEPMCQFVQQDSLPSASRESEFVEGDISWNKSEILDIISFSINMSLFAFPQTEPLCDGARVPICSLLCDGPCIPEIPRVPSKAKEIFSCMHKVFNELREYQTTGRPILPSANRDQELGAGDVSCNKSKIRGVLSSPVKGDFMEPHFQSKQNYLRLFNRVLSLEFCGEIQGALPSLGKGDFMEYHFQSKQNYLQLVNRVLCLESQLRKVCALDCRMYILPLMKSFLRLQLYFYLRCNRFKMGEANPAAQSPGMPYQEEWTEQQGSCDESESEYDSDLDEKPWRDNPTLCSLDSTLSKSASGKTEGIGPFFWVAISDVLRQCGKNRLGAYESVVDGIRWFRLNKTWKYWLCYDCGSTFLDRESHMVHLENEHQLSMGHNEYWLIPQRGSRDEGEEFKEGAVKRDTGLEDSITLDDTRDYFLVDSTKFYEIPSADEEKDLGQEKCKQYLDIVADLQNQISHLRQLIQNKCETITHLEVADALGLMLFSGDQPLLLLVNCLQKLSITLSTGDCFIGTTHMLQFQFLSQLLNKAYGEGYGPLSKVSVIKAFEDMRLDRDSEKILRAVDQIDNMKRCLSDLCVCDYRMKIVPSVRSFLHAKFKLIKSLSSLECNSVKVSLSSLDQLELQADSFQVTVLSPGKVVINTMEKSSWALAFIGIHLRFVGRWAFTGSKSELTGGFKYGGWFGWGPKITYGRSGSVMLDNGDVTTERDLDFFLCDAVSEKLLCLKDMYEELICCDGVVVSAN